MVKRLGSSKIGRLAVSNSVYWNEGRQRNAKIVFVSTYNARCNTNTVDQYDMWRRNTFGGGMTLFIAVAYRRESGRARYH